MIERQSRNQDAKRAKKKYGQNFLKDETVLGRIIQSMPNDDLEIVEIGPGLGDLTKYLVEKKDVTAFEVDQDLCEHLLERFADAIGKKQLALECGDVLSHWEKGSLKDRPYHLVANLPYYIATNIILRGLKDPNCQSLLVMVQKEVAVKFAAQPGEKAFSSLSILARSVGTPSVLFDVPPEAFVPRPKVVSAILRILKRESLEDTEFERFLKVAFKQPRKTLAKNLSSDFAKERVVQALATCGLQRMVRPHEVETSHYHRLYKILNDKGDMNGRKKTAR